MPQRPQVRAVPPKGAQAARAPRPRHNEGMPEHGCRDARARGIRRPHHPRRQPHRAPDAARRLLHADLPRSAVQHRTRRRPVRARRTCARSRAPRRRAPTPPPARRRRHLGVQGSAVPAHPRRPLQLRRPLRGLLGLPRAAPHRGLATARRRRHPLPAPRLPRGALREGDARRPVRSRVLPERAHLGLRLRSQVEEALADEARHDPRLREEPEGATGSTPPPSTASPTWRRVS